MNGKALVLGVTAALTVGALSTSASAQIAVGSNSQKGSLLIFPRIQVGKVGSGVDTLISITNDGNTSVRLKCFYATSDPLATPYTGTAIGARPLKHFADFTIDLTHNQPVEWWASSGMPYASSAYFGGPVANPFGTWPDGATRRLTGELKCWAVTPDQASTMVYNDLTGTATLYLGRGQASGYTAWAFRAYGTAGTALATPGVLNLDGNQYDACPAMLIGRFHALGSAVSPGNRSRVTLASCNEDMREKYIPTITKLTWTFWNQDESARTGTRACADSWFETSFPATAPVGSVAWPMAQFWNLGTQGAYFRIQTIADTQICGPDAETSAYVGIVEHRDAAGNNWATNLTGTGAAPGVIRYNTGP